MVSYKDDSLVAIG